MVGRRCSIDASALATSSCSGRSLPIRSPASAWIRRDSRELRACAELHEPIAHRDRRAAEVGDLRGGGREQDPDRVRGRGKPVPAREGRAHVARAPVGPDLHGDPLEIHEHPRREPRRHEAARRADREGHGVLVGFVSEHRHVRVAADLPELAGQARDRRLHVTGIRLRLEEHEPDRALPVVRRGARPPRRGGARSRTRAMGGGDRPPELLGAREAIRGLLGQAPQHDLLELAGQGRQRRRARRAKRQVRLLHLGRGADEGRVAGQHLVEDRAGCVEIRARIDRVAAGALLG